MGNGGKGNHSDQIKKSQKHKECLDDAIKEIKRAEFVSIDLEFSGICFSNKKFDSVEEYYQSHTQSVPNFLAVELGVCCVRRGDKLNEWIFSPFTFPLYPSQRTLFFSDSISLSWLIQQGFDIQKWVSDGYDYRGLAYLQQEDRQLKNATALVRISGAQRVISTIIETEKPLILHNGLLDLLHIYQKFITKLPLQWADLGQQLCDFFSGGIYDTKRLASSEPKRFFDVLPPRILSLDHLQAHFASQPTNLTFKLTTHVKWLNHVEQYKAACVNYSTNKETVGLREGGYGAMMKAQVFLSELEVLCRDLEESEAISKDWRNIEACRNIENTFHLPGPLGVVQLPTIPRPAKNGVLDSG
eukprot:Protomagalhaensia_sp_Gyna_25__929@NODE_1448_length_1825_cov_68_614222_g1172_i0_p1_GENE_NODE_1448_length_1825_cov_68_614222_g1172_i0NODE_1448_length_1825_cov_68_614222_g1172_i0_p1_ORF_typecomplete_len357_score60_79CAF1/PF04857_20/1e42_NODE_1448_length_1825_cov_68_614222_g1172_i07351805